MHAEKSSARLEGEADIVTTRLLSAPRELVWRALSQPEHLVHFWGPHGFATTSHAMDFRVGGEWRFTMHGPDGKDYPNLILYTRIEAPERIEYDHGDGSPTPPHFRAVILLKEEAGGTRVELRLIAPSREAREELSRFGAVEGGIETLERLEARVELLLAEGVVR